MKAAIALAGALVGCATTTPSQYQPNTRARFEPAVLVARKVLPGDVEAIEGVDGRVIGRVPAGVARAQRVAAEHGGTHVLREGAVEVGESCYRDRGAVTCRKDHERGGWSVYRVDPELFCELPPELRPRKPLTPLRCR